MSTTSTSETIPPAAGREASYDVVPHLFLELRGRGQSLSAADMDVLSHWKSQGIPADLVIQAALDLADRCLAEARPFPSTLAGLDRRIKKLLKRLSEY